VQKDLFDLKYRYRAVCPYCGHEHKDCWEWSRDEDECECRKCGKNMGYERHVEITYSTWKLDK